jgi:hypothetical protein
MAVAHAVDRVHRDDPDAAAHRALVTRGRHADCRRLVTWLADRVG